MPLCVDLGGRRIIKKKNGRMVLAAEGRKANVFFFKQKTAYEIYRCDWSSDVCSSDL